MKIIIIFYYCIAICIASQSLFRHFLTCCQRIICILFFFRKIFFLNSKSQFLCFKHHCDKKFTFMILFKHVLRIHQIMFKNSIIFAEEKFFSTYEIIKFFSLFLILQSVLYFIFFVFVYKNHFRRNDDIYIYIIWF